MNQEGHIMRSLPRLLQAIKLQRHNNEQDGGCFKTDSLFWSGKSIREYFESISSRKAALLWVTKTIYACWDYNMVEGKKELIETIKQEFNIGFSHLPAYGFIEMFRQKQDDIFKESMDTIQN